MPWQKIHIKELYSREMLAYRSSTHVKETTFTVKCEYQGNDFKAIQGNDFKALIYEFMNGESLETWLHLNEENNNEILEVGKLSRLQRVNIAVDVACALDYIHHGCEVRIVHRDLKQKPSNVLLDTDMVAHVGDFVLARFLPQPSHPNQSSSPAAVKGTIGYAAPEYGLGADPTTAGDVYSYGFLLEMMTGKRPTEEMFNEAGLNLHTYVSAALPDNVMQIIDPSLLDNEGDLINDTRTRGETAIIGR
ncbi:probable LRR receptor-like serine/threonine-protein kinase At3g47570 isoform X2 [Spinacia oleracea]|uniref:Probable LRR receptor-like serine/threonine-protein kinase At3g47570 isoform X2 n=1 Tax=Spinacia oleracea TaxID=3562 RepID=A0ABM3RB16_SPIOL|nr:probable LRR receptor-like serine/threonine-protein kinase At3g47570 isoform X2 [Spinacia oleracea]